MLHVYRLLDDFSDTMRSVLPQLEIVGHRDEAANE